MKHIVFERIIWYEGKALVQFSTHHIDSDIYQNVTAQELLDSITEKEVD